MPTSHRSPRAARARAGFTLIEVMISMMLLLVLMGAATGFFRTQLRALSRDSGRFDAQQNSNYAVNLLDQEIRAAGVGTPQTQPLIVQASPETITFNGDLVTRIADDPSSVYYDPDAPAAATDNLTYAKAVTLPLFTANKYPIARKTFDGAAETISYWVTADTVSGKSDELMLMRRVNDMAPRLVARGIKKVTGQPVFSYYSKSGDPDVGGYAPITTITSTAPAFHSDSTHSNSGILPGTTTSEKANSLLADRIAMVKVTLTSIYRDARGDSALRTVTRNIRVMNAGLMDQAVCGGNPAMPAILTVPSRIDYSSDGGVTIDWSASADETGGTQDVQRYLLFKRLDSTGTAFTEPFKIVPADGITEYTDRDVTVGKAYFYGVAAQDCGLATSAIKTNSTSTDIRP